METMTCLCGLSYDRHHGQGHPYVEKHPAFASATLARGALFQAGDLNPATNLYITVEDRLRVQIINAVAGIEVDVTARIQLVDGQVIPMRQVISPAATRAVITTDFDLCEGFVLDLTITTPTAAARAGGCFVLCSLIRGQGTNAIPSRILVSNYLSSGNAIGWPEGPSQPSTQGPGLVRSLQQANPVAGADWVVTVPVGARWVLQSLSAQLVTAVAVANRFPHLQIRDGAGNVMWDTAAAAAQAASLTVRYSATGGVQAVVVDTSAVLPIPDLVQLLQGWTIQTATGAIQAADQWQNIWLNVVELQEL
jgi:hypothetical protein